MRNVATPGVFSLSGQAAPLSSMPRHFFGLPKATPAPLCPLTSNCALLVLVELSLDKAEDKAGLAYCRLPQQDQLKLTDLVPSSWSIGSCCTSPTRHGPSRCSGTSEREGRGRCYAKRHLVGTGASNCKGETRNTGLVQRLLRSEPFLNHRSLPLPSLMTWLTVFSHPNSLLSIPRS